MAKKVYEITRNLIKSGLNALGFDLIRTNKLAGFNLCGLKNLNINTVIDVGANQGQFARAMRAHFPEASFICFEPLPEPFAVLRNWANESPGKVRAYNLALGDRNGEAQMFFHRDYSPSSSLLANTNLGESVFPAVKNQERVTVQLVTLDHALRGITLMENILIKLDVQGYEDRVLKGGIDTFCKAAACILEISLDDLYQGQAGFRELYMQFDQMNYRYAGNLDQVHAADGHVIYLDAVFVQRGIKYYDD